MPESPRGAPLPASERKTSGLRLSPAVLAGMFATSVMIGTIVKGCKEENARDAQNQKASAPSDLRKSVDHSVSSEQRDLDVKMTDAIEKSIQFRKSLELKLDDAIADLAANEDKLRSFDRAVDDKEILDTIYEINKNARALTVLSRVFSGPQGPVVHVLDFQTAAEAIRQAIPNIKDDLKVSWAIARADQMEERSMLAFAQADEANGNAKVSFDFKQERVLVDAQPLRTWFASRYSTPK